VPLGSINLARVRSAADELYDYLRAAILAGNLEQHERLVESALAERAAVSRTPVREALHRLEVDGLVQPSPGGGVEVFSLTSEELADLCAVREVLEGMASGLAASSRTEIDLAALQSVVESEAQADEAGSSDVETRVLLNHSFHDTLWRISRNRYLAAKLQEIRARIEGRSDSTLHSLERQAQALGEHRQLLDAIASKDSETAERLARVHVRNAMAARMIRHSRSAAGG
jgi:DNA-binding GntR family transcriptional regulator